MPRSFQKNKGDACDAPPLRSIIYVQLLFIIDNAYIADTDAGSLLSPATPDGSVVVCCCNICRSSASNTSSLSARSTALRLSAVSQHPRSAHKYAPRPARLPVGSIATWPSGSRTSRVRPRFVSILRHAMHVRCGTCFGRGVCRCFAIPADAEPIIEPNIIYYTSYQPSAVRSKL